MNKNEKVVDIYAKSGMITKDAITGRQVSVAHTYKHRAV